MIFLTLYSFLAGVVTILSPCILPVLPILLSGSIGGKSRPLGIIIGFITAFTAFTLFLSLLVRATGVSPDLLRNLSIIVISAFGLSLIIPAIQSRIEIVFSKFAASGPKANKAGFYGGLIIGLSLGLLWTPCVGPILASVIALALTGSVSGAAFFITLAYALGTSIPMFAIMIGGQNLMRRVSWFTRNTSKIQKIFGVIMIVTAVLIFFNIDRQFQTFILSKFPRYGAGLTKIEDNKRVRNELNQVLDPDRNDVVGKTTNEIIEENLGLAPEIVPGGAWFNSKPLKIANLRGKVVLVDFWTYTCINCIRTLPYIKSWQEKYADKGLVIIGVHTPEFEFEKSASNVKKAIADFGLKYPIVQDNNYATWNAFDNHYWPAKYFIDKNGKIRKTHFGEGEYDESEEFIQKLLAETGEKVSSIPIANPTYAVAARTPETYVGYNRLQYYSSPENVLPDKKSTYTAPTEIPLNTIAFRGEWTVGGEYSKPEKGAVLYSAFEAQNVYLVMRPGKKVSKVRVYLDDKPINVKEAGEDVRDGVVDINADRLYGLVKLQKSGKHILKLEFVDEGIEVFAFTFG